MALRVLYISLVSLMEDGDLGIGDVANENSFACSSSFSLVTVTLRMLLV